ncbi:MAG: glycosyltransferase family 4 protein [Proteobacteria bacterium]|nr:glycosyltransferase family 4 protein [Desulfobulbaceae bacterium]MBU4154129.1 glycosyltransferase family 4 protein [Pseudomonadota bacterium]
MHTIIHVITRLDMGGSAQNTLQTCLGTANRYRVMLVHGLSEESAMTENETASVLRQTEAATKRGVVFHPMAALIRKISPWQDLLAFFTLWWLFIREKPAIVHTHTSKAGIIGRLAAWLAQVPNIIHTPHGHVFYGHFSARTAKTYLIIEKIFYHITDYLVALTHGERNDYLRLGVGKAERLVLIHSGVELEEFHQAGRLNHPEEIKKNLGLSRTEKIVGTAGWLLPIKGPLVLLAAMGRVWQRYPEAELVYVGKGDLEQEIRDRAKSMGHQSQVKLLGWRSDVHTIMGLFDCFVLPSLNEGMGRVLVEAMAANCPVVASNTGGIPDLISHDANGLLVPPNDEKSLAEAILRVLDNPELTDRLRAEGQTVCQRYSLTAMLEKLHQLYAKVLNK